MWLRGVDAKKIGVEVFGELLNVKENGEDEMVRESN